MRNEELYENLKCVYQLTLCGIPIEDLKAHADAINEYYVERKICDMMCGGEDE